MDSRVIASGSVTSVRAGESRDEPCNNLPKAAVVATTWQQGGKRPVGGQPRWSTLPSTPGPPRPGPTLVDSVRWRTFQKLPR
jgi:hypothetical protein